MHGPMNVKSKISGISSQNIWYHFSKYHNVLELFLHPVNVSLTLCWTVYRLQFIWVAFI